jgi:hypothetical protein
MHEGNGAGCQIFGLSCCLQMLTVLQTIDVALGLMLAIVLTRSTAAEVRKLWKN